MKGMSHSEMADRRVMLAHNTPMVIEAMKESGLSDPVGIIADTRDKMGRKLFKMALLASGKSEQDADDEIRAMSKEMAKKEQILTGILVVDWKRAEQILPLTSPTATETLGEVRRLHHVQKDSYAIVAVGSGGNTYTLVVIDDLPTQPQHVEDGQHRVRGIYFPKQ